MTQDPRQLLELARGWMKQGNTTVAFQLLNEAIKLEQTDGDKLVKGEITKEIGRAYILTGHWERAEDACQQAASIFLDQNYYKGAAEAIRNLANMKFQQGLFDESNVLCKRAVDWATESGDFQLRATILNTQGAIKSIEGNQKEAIKILRMCLSDFQRSGNRLRQAYVFHNIGLAQLETGEYIKAKSSLEEALSLALENKDTNLVEICYQNMAKLYLRLGDICAARSLIRPARELLEILKSPNLTADLAIIEAEAYRISGDLRKADSILELALEAARENNLLQHEAEILCEAGQAAIELGQPDIARSRLEAAITIFRKTGSNQLEKAVERLKNLEASAKREVRVA